MVGLAVGLLATEHRRALAAPWPWAGLGLALLVFLPNLAWQATHELATFEFASHLREEILATQGRVLFAAGQLLYFHPLTIPIWLGGLLARDRAIRPFAWLAISVFVVLLVIGGKPYYLGIVYPTLFAAGGVVLERWFATLRRLLLAYGGALATGGLSFGLLTLPILPIVTVDAVLGKMFGWAVPPIALTHDMHGMFGWEEHVATVARVSARLPREDRDRALVLTGTYSQAAALNVLGNGANLPPAVSGYMTYYLWGTPPERGDVLITYDVPRRLLERHYREVTIVDRIVAPLARPRDRELSVFLCRAPREPIASWWNEVKRNEHRRRL
jgi:hypothetical protein